MNTQRGNTLVWLLGLIGLAVIVFLIFKSDRTPDAIEMDDITPPATEQVVFEGEVVCLPHRDTSGPTTLECAYGVKTDDGKYYGLDGESLPTEKQGGYEVGQRVAFEGTLVPQTDMPDGFWMTYNVVGLIKIEDYWQYRDK